MAKRADLPLFTSVTAVVSGVLAVVTVFFRDWIEITGWDPDHHSGSLEWVVIGVLAAISLASGAAAGVQWRRRVAA